MPPGLTYPSLKCVFEFLEANKRIHITSRNSNLKTLDKLVPLRLKMVQIDELLIMVNNVAYRVLGVNEPEDSFGNDFERFYSNQQFGSQIPRGYFPIFFQKNGTGNTRYEYGNRRGKIFRRRICKDYHSEKLKSVITFQFLILRLLESLFVGRRVIIVEKLVTGRLLPLSKKLELKFNILELEPEGYHLKDFVPLIDPTSFPLKKLTQKPFSPIFFEQPEVRTANHLVINNFYNFFNAINILKSLNCKYVEIKDLLFNENDILDTIQMLLENHRDVETCYMIDTFEKTSNLMERIKERFNGTDENFMNAEKRSTLTSQYVSIPIDSRTELAVYRNKSLKERREIVIMEVILTGHTPKVFHLDYSKLSESFEKKYSDDDDDNETEDDRSPNGESNQSYLGKHSPEKFKMPIISLPIASILIVALFAWFFFFGLAFCIN